MIPISDMDDDITYMVLEGMGYASPVTSVPNGKYNAYRARLKKLLDDYSPIELSEARDFIEGTNMLLTRGSIVECVKEQIKVGYYE